MLFQLQDVLSNQSGEALKKLKAAAQVEKDLRDQLGTVKFASKAYEESFKRAKRIREEALAEVITTHH